MPWAVREFLCGGCGKPITVRAAAEAKPLCAPCGIAKSTDQIIQMHQRDGDAYERWLLATIEALTKRLEAYRRRKSYEDIADTFKG